MRVKKEENKEDSAQTSRSPSPLTRSVSSDQFREIAAKTRKQEEKKPVGKSHLKREDKTTTYKYNQERKKDKEPESKRLLEKVNEILKSCDKINKDDESVEREREESKVEVSTNKEKRTISIVEKTSASRDKPASSSSPRLRGRPRSYSRSRSPRRRGSPRYSPMRFRRPYSRSRSPSRSPPPRYRPLWIAVSPLSLISDVSLEKASKCRVLLSLRDQFAFASNSGSVVKISKWSGREGVNCVVVSPQLVTLQEGQEIEVEIENPYYDRTLRLRKHEKIACLSILTCPVPRYLSDTAPDRFCSQTQRWFRVSQAVLHRKGLQTFLS